jgi:glycosyltransferase involved in cell wall biosynthesis
VIAGGVHYLEDRLDPRIARHKLIETDWDGIPVTLTYAKPNFRRSVLARLQSYLTFARYAFRASRRVPDLDGVMVSIQPMFVAPLAWLVARWRRVPFLLEVRDLWPDVAAEVGLIRSRFLLRLGYSLERFVYRRAAHIFVIGPGMKDAIVAKGIPPERIDVMPQGYQAPNGGAKSRLAMRGALDIDPGTFVVMFTGSFGLANNDVGVIVEAAARLRDEPGLQIVMVGEGNRKRDCEERVRRDGLDHVRFLPMVPKREIPSLLAAADAAIMALPKGDVWRICFQNKIFDYMGAGLPVIAAVAGDQEDLLRNATGGIVVPPEDVEGIARAILTLKNDPDLRHRLGANARSYVERHLKREQILNSYIDKLESLLEPPRGSSSAQA